MKASKIINYIQELLFFILMFSFSCAIFIKYRNFSYYLRLRTQMSSKGGIL